MQIRLGAVDALQWNRTNLHDPIHPLSHDLQCLLEGVNVGWCRSVAIDPDRAKVADLTVYSIDTVGDAEGYNDGVITLHAVDLGAHEEDGVLGTLVLWQDAVEHDRQSVPGVLEQAFHSWSTLTSYSMIKK